MIVPSGKEMNFFDLCVAAWRALGRLCSWCGRLLARMVRLTYRYWWAVITVIVLALGAAYYYTRAENLTHRVNAVVLLNGPSIQQFEEVYAPMRSLQLLPQDSPMAPYLYSRTAHTFCTFRVIDAMDDSSADYIDFNGTTKLTDTVNVPMHDRLCVQFRIKRKNMHLLPEIEHALLATINADPVFQQAYKTYMENLREEVAFNHRQAIKLDSLTSNYYYYTASAAQPMSYSGNGVNFYGDRKIRLFLNDIYKQHDRMMLQDHRLQLATDPVSLEARFAVDPKPVLSRPKGLVLALLAGWCLGCLIAAFIDRRKFIAEWLKAA